MQDSIQDSSQGVGQNLPYAQTTTPLKEPPPYPLQSIPGSSVQRQIQYVPQPFNYAQPLPPSRRLIRGLGSLTDHWVARLERLKGGLGTFERETDCLEALEGVARKFEPHIAIHAICELEADRIRGRKGGDPLKAIWIVAEQCKAKIARDPNLLHPDAQHTRRAFQRANLGL